MFLMFAKKFNVKLRPGKFQQFAPVFVLFQLNDNAYETPKRVLQIRRIANVINAKIYDIYSHMYTHLCMCL